MGKNYRGIIVNLLFWSDSKHTNSLQFSFNVVMNHMTIYLTCSHRHVRSTSRTCSLSLRATSLKPTVSHTMPRENWLSRHFSVLWKPLYAYSVWCIFLYHKWVLFIKLYCILYFFKVQNKDLFNIWSLSAILYKLGYISLQYNTIV